MKINKKPSIYFSTYDDIKNPLYGGGGAIAVHEVAKRLSKKYEVRVLSWDYSGKKKEIVDGVSYERFGMRFINPKMAMFFYQASLPFMAMTKHYDVWMESFCPPFTTSALPLFIKKPVIGIVHMLAAEDMERKYKLPFNFIQNIGIKTYKYNIVTSETLRKKIVTINSSSSVTVISNGITAVHKPTIKKQKYILFLGRIEVDQKGIDLLISAFKQFHLRFDEYKLIIAGNGDAMEIAKTKELITITGLKNNIVLKGRVAGKAKEMLLSNAACVVIPSRFETYSLVALESMAYGAPVITFAIDGLKWISTKIAKKVPAYNITNLSESISNVVSDKELSASMIKEGNDYAQQFTWEKIAKQYDDYIKTLLNGKIHI
jgi:glycosyltransferase involved in cell wall biosynthesis